MSYQVLARKWRPQTFIEMAGQDHVLQALVNALRQQRLHHAYLFTGTRGVGKTTIARIFAKCLNCETNGISPEPCGTCASCVEITQGNFVDLIEVDAASRTKVEDTRELLENVQYAPTRGRFKVYLIDEVHMLSTHSFNALLKTLEEPPEHVKFLLATTDPQKLPVTVLSRCLQFNLKNMSSSRVVNYLTKILSEEQLSFDEAALWQIGQAANGSMRDALSLTDQAIAFGDGVISETGVTSMLGLVNQSQILTLVEMIASNDAQSVLNKITELADYQPDFVALCANLMDVLHRVAIEQQVPGALEDQLGDLERIRMLAQRISPQEVQLLYQSLLMGRKDLHLAHAPKSGFEMLMLRLIAFRPAAPVNIEMSAEPVKATVITSPSVPSPSTELNATESSAIESNIVEPPLNPVVQQKQPLQSEPIAEPIHQADSHSISNQTAATAAMSAEERPPWEASPVGDADVPVVENTEKKVEPKAVAMEPSPVDSSPVDSHLNATPYQSDLSANSDFNSDNEIVQDSNLAQPNSSLEVEAAYEDYEEEKSEEEQSVEEQSGHAIVDRSDAVQSSEPLIHHPAKSLVDDTIEEDESDVEEMAINESLDPHFSVSDLVNALASTDEAEDSVGENDADASDVSLSKAQKRVVDTIAQPALAMELPPLNHFSELTMQLWWLVAPRLELTGLVQNIVMNSSLIEATELGLKIQVPLEYGHMLNQVRYEQIQQALGDFFGVVVPLIIDTVEDVTGVTAEEFAASKRAEALQAAIDHLNTHPIVKALGENLNGQLIYESVKVKA